MGNMSTIENGTTYSVFKRRVLDKKDYGNTKGCLYVGTGKETSGVYDVIKSDTPIEKQCLTNSGNDVPKWDYLPVRMISSYEQYMESLMADSLDENVLYILM